MCLIRVLSVALLSIALHSFAQAKGHPKAPTTIDTEARNEIDVPSFSGQIRDARRVARFLTDALVLSNAQQHAVMVCTVTLHEALALAPTDTSAALAQQEYLVAMQRVLATSQVQTYAVLVQKLSGTMQPLLERLELAVR